MPTDDKERLATLRREIELIRELREELDLKGTLLRTGARAAWEDLDSRFQAAQEEVERLGDHRAVGRDFDRTAHTLFEIRHGYEHVRRSSGAARARTRD